MRHAVFAALQSDGVVGRKNSREPADFELLNRFSASRDEAAFEALVLRHGPMVQGVCRRILGDVHAAEDAFQAVFLVLARKSNSIRRPELLANWLYGVACRIARKARTRARRHEGHERRAGKMPLQEQLLDLEWAEVKAVLDDELSRLPEKYRAPLVLCYLRGQTNAEAAAQLGWPTGSISERLARARELLRRRLNRRGLNLSAGLLAVLLAQKAASAAVSPLLVEATVKVGATAGAPEAVAGSASQAVLDLASESSESRIARRVKTFAAALVAALLIAAVWTEVSQSWSRGGIAPGGAAIAAGLSRESYGQNARYAKSGGQAKGSAAVAAPAAATGGSCH